MPDLPASRWESPHQRRLIGPATMPDEALSLLHERLLEHHAIKEAYLLEIEIIEPSRGTSRATNLALWLDPDAAGDELGMVDRLADSAELATLQISLLAPAGRAAARRRGRRLL
jgi:hypothetical protein